MKLGHKIKMEANKEHELERKQVQKIKPRIGQNMSAERNLLGHRDRGSGLGGPAQVSKPKVFHPPVLGVSSAEKRNDFKESWPSRAKCRRSDWRMP